MFGRSANVIANISGTREERVEKDGAFSLIRPQIMMTLHLFTFLQILEIKPADLKLIGICLPSIGAKNNA